MGLFHARTVIRFAAVYAACAGALAFAAEVGSPLAPASFARAQGAAAAMQPAMTPPATMPAPRPAPAPPSPAVGSTTPDASGTAAPQPPVVDPEAFAAALALVRSEALAKGIAPDLLDAAFADLAPDPDVVRLAGHQPEHARTAGDYVQALVSPKRIADGQEQLAAQAGVLAAIEATTGVSRHVVVAVWGVESNFGASMGERALVRSLATLAATDARRAAFWRAELVAGLRIVAAGDVPLARLTGSWAGAMGHTQFMPTTFLAHAVDHDRDGRRDIWGAPTDALASAANYLAVSGWVRGEPWGFEVVLPEGLDLGLSSPGQARPADQWRALGLARPGGAAWPAVAGPMALLLPAGARGPAFLTTRGFRAILRYNASTSYALAIGHLADRLAGGPPLATPWPADDVALSRAEREEIQRRLTELGHDTGGIDGILGGRTREAIRTYQRGVGLPADGHPGAAVLSRLRAGP